ncbi:MAG: gliding motility lipoprotein GldD [Bacteroidia bacterium]|nr:gliding motility lipoprotein GldD [Bacteroidia bacterium]
MKRLLLPLTCILALTLAGCFEEELSPRPKGYFRIEFPEKSYRTWDSAAPFTFDVPGYCRVLPDTGENVEAYWYNLDYTPFKAMLHLSYKKVDNNINEYLAQSRQLAIQHQVKASGMKESPIINDSSKVYGLLYEFGGNTASSVQFYLTDSTRHFVRGALYFWARPNADSIGPSLNFLTEDIYRMVETFRWNEIK